MIVKQLTFDQEARESLISGIKKLAQAVKSTLGPEGKFVAIESESQIGGMTVTKDGVTVANNINLYNPNEDLAVRMFKQAAQGSNVVGDGPQPLYSKVLTPNGWVNLGDIKVGDKICSIDGGTQGVLGVFDKGELEICNLVMSDGRVIECSEDHLFTVTTSWGTEKTVKASEIESFVKGSKYLRVPEIDMLDSNITLDPYLLGLLLGDGCLRKNGSIELSLGYNKVHVLDKISLPEGVSYNTKDYTSKNYVRVKFNGEIRSIIDSLGLLDVNSHTKFIPKNYLYSSKKTRLALLSGLLDTDGYINKRGLFEFSTVSDSLCRDFIELITSLGYQYNYRLHLRDNDKDSYSENPIHRITQIKGYKHGVKIKEFKRTGEYTSMKCIKVSSDDHLYITDGFLPTHNTTSSVVIAEAIIMEAKDELDPDIHSTTEVARHIKRLSDEAIKRLDKRSKKLTGGRLLDVATISANNDKTLGKLISDGYKHVGRTGLVSVAQSKTFETHLEKIDGIRIDRGFTSKTYITDPKRNECVLEDAFVLVTDQEVPAAKNIYPILEYVIKQNKPLLIIGELNIAASAPIEYNVAVNKVLKACNIIPPSFGFRREEMMKDICQATGSEFISEKLGNDWNNITPSMLGHIDKAIISDNRTVLINNELNEATIDLISDLNDKIDKEEVKSKKDALMDRLSCISGKAAVIHVGGMSDIEIKEKKDRVDDSVLATRAALEEGILPGGGVALLREARNIKLQDDDPNEIAAANILGRAMTFPFFQIIKNAGLDFDSIGEDVLDQDVYQYGYNVKTRKAGDMYKMGVIDPAKVTKSALMNAVSVATTIMMCDTVITNMRSDESVK